MHIPRFIRGAFIMAILVIPPGCYGTHARIYGQSGKPDPVPFVGWGIFHSTRSDLSLFTRDHVNPFDVPIGFLSLPFDLAVDVVLLPADLIAGLFGYRHQEINYDY